MSSGTPSAAVDVPFAAIVLAGQRGPDDPLVSALGVPCKALAPIDGEPMVLGVLEALAASRDIGALWLCGSSRSAMLRSARLRLMMESSEVQWMQGAASPSASVHRALSQMSRTTPVLVTTADHALLDARTVDYFCTAARDSDCDLLVAVTRYEAVANRHPQMRKTVIRLNDGNYCGCNLFAFMTEKSRAAAEFWQQVERERKRPWRMISKIGWWNAVRYGFARLSLRSALESLSDRIGARVGAVELPFPDAAIDVDTLEDWSYVEDLIKRRNSVRGRGAAGDA